MNCARYMCAALCALAVNSQVLAAPGDLDFTFGQAGRVIIDFENDDDLPAGLALQPDGKLIVGRENSNEADDFSVLRFLADGSPDTSFDSDGRTSVDFPAIRGTTVSVLTQPDGKIIVVGWAYGNSTTPIRLALMRYLANGSPDVSFGNGGLVLGDGRFYVAMLSATLLPDGRLVVAGQRDQSGANHSTVALARFLPDGSPDLSFGQSGYAYSSGTTAEWGAHVARQEDGKLLAFTDVSLAAPQAWYDWQPAIMRFLPDGSTDATFGVNGRATLPLYTSFLSALVQPDGKILLAAASDPYAWGLEYCGSVLARLHPDGRYDEGFGVEGVRNVYVGSCETFAPAMLMEPDGKIVLNGSKATSHPGSPVIDSNDYVVTRLNPDGEHDGSFGDVGQAVLDVGDGPYPPYAYNIGSLLRQDDGKLLVLTVGIKALVSWGENNRLVLARLLPSGGSPGLIGIKAVDPQVSGSDGGIVLRVRRSGGSVGQASVDYATTSGGGTLTWADGDRDDKMIMTRAGAGTLSLANVRGGAGLATRQIQLPAAAPAPPPPPPPAPVPPTPPGSSGGGGAMTWEFLLALALGIMALNGGSRRARRTKKGG